MTEELKSNLRAALFRSTTNTIRSLKDILRKESKTYNSVLLLEIRHEENRQKLLRGTVTDEAAQVEKNRIRELLLGVIDELEAHHLESTRAAESPRKEREIIAGETRQPTENQADKKLKVKDDANLTAPPPRKPSKEFVIKILKLSKNAKVFKLTKDGATTSAEVNSVKGFWNNTLQIKIAGNVVYEHKFSSRKLILENRFREQINFKHAGKSYTLNAEIKINWNYQYIEELALKIGGQVLYDSKS